MPRLPTEPSRLGISAAARLTTRHLADNRLHRDSPPRRGLSRFVGSRACHVFGYVLVNVHALVRARLAGMARDLGAGGQAQDFLKGVVTGARQAA